MLTGEGTSGQTEADASRSQILPGAVPCGSQLLPSTDRARPHWHMQLGGLAVPLLRVHICGLTCPTGTWGRAELGAELSSWETGQHRDSWALTGSGDDPISFSFSSWVEERWSCSSVFSACGRKQTG